jgi:N-acetylated-alpha-linked acidic dipeptidase
MEDSNALASIPSLPLSWEDAQPLLKATEGHGVVGEFDWRGGLNQGYYSGPSEGLVEMENIVSYNVTPIWNVIGRIEGSVEPHRSVILGNHRDSWVYGAVDPSSGSATLVSLFIYFFCSKEYASNVYTYFFFH